MAYSLEFSPEFFLAEGEPYDRSDYAVNAEGKPVSVWSAIGLIDKERWAELALEVFELENPELLTPESVLELIQQTDTCSNLSSPVEVWIDSEGYFKIEVYENCLHKNQYVSDRNTFICSDCDEELGR